MVTDRRPLLSDGSCGRLIMTCAAYEGPEHSTKESRSGESHLSMVGSTSATKVWLPFSSYYKLCAPINKLAIVLNYLFLSPSLSPIGLSSGLIDKQLFKILLLIQ